MNILLTSSGRRSYLVTYFKDALKGRGLVHAANSIPSVALAIADKSVITPPIYSKNYIDFLLDYCSNNDIYAILSLFDADLPVLSANASSFNKRGIKVAVSRPETINICNDKWGTYKYALQHNFLMPKTFLSIADAETAISNNAVSFPFVVKPRWGMGSIGLYSAENHNELKFLYEKVKKDILKSYLSYESKCDIDHAVLIQEKLEGIEYGADIINTLDGDYVTTFTKRKIAMRSGETDVAITEDNPMLSEFGKKISLTLTHIGILDSDIFIVNGNPYLLELNNRFGGGYPFSHLAGANIPLAYIYWLEGKTPPSICFNINANITGMKDICIVKGLG